MISIITPAIAKAFGTGVGGTVSYQFQAVNAQGQPSGKPFTRSIARVRVASVRAARNVMIATTAASALPAIESFGTIALSPRA